MINKKYPYGIASLDGYYIDLIKNKIIMISETKAIYNDYYENIEEYI